jgi:valyl-tRNA synthetase
VAAAPEMIPLLEEQAGLICSLAFLDSLEVSAESPARELASESVPSTGSMVFLETKDSSADADLQAKLVRELEDAQSHIHRLEKLLASDFASKAPAPVVEKEREKLENYRQAAEKIARQLRS